MKFKVGDKVRIKENINGIDTHCITDNIINQFKNKNHIVKNTLQNGDTNFLNLEEDNFNLSWNEDLFELVEENKEPYMKITPNGFEFSCSQISIIKQNTLPKQVFFNDKKKTTVLKWEDDSITKVKCHDDEFDERTGFLIAYFQKTCGLTKNKANKYLDSLLPKEDKPIDILDTKEDMVFSIYKWIESQGYKPNDYDWTYQCDGKTVKECKPFSMYDSWLVPRSQFKPYKEN